MCCYLSHHCDESFLILNYLMIDDGKVGISIRNRVAMAELLQIYSERGGV